jgi:hypothetical protein
VTQPTQDGCIRKRAAILDPFVFQDRLTEVFKILNIWFNANLLSLNVSRTDYIKFTTKNFYEQDNYINIACVNKNISDSYHTKFLRINIINTLSWQRHFHQLLLKRNTASYAIRTVKPYMNQETLLMVY